MSSPVSYTLEGNIGVITGNNPPVNALSQPVRQGIVDAVAAAEGDKSEVVLVICDGRTFIAGADITEFGKPPAEPWLPSVFDRMEALDKPVVAALHGTALGGGFEAALAAHYRCAVPAAKVGLPEVKLGLLPGAGGTQRTPRLAGVPEIVLARARHILGDLEEGAPLPSGAPARVRGVDERGTPQLDLFVPASEKRSSEVEETLRNLDIDQLKPVDALVALARLKEMLRDG